MTKIRNGLTIIGASLVPKKLVDLITRLTGDGYKGDAKAVVFEEHDTSDKFGCYYPEGRVITIFLQRHLIDSLEKVKNEKDKSYDMALHAVLWWGLINTTIHEFLHNESHKVCRDEGEPFEDNEEAIEEEAHNKMVEMFKEYDLEPPMLGEYGFLETIGVAADLLKTMTDSDEEWVKKQRGINEFKVIFSNEDLNIHLETMREFIFHAEHVDETDMQAVEGWRDEPKPLVEEITPPEEEIIGEHGFKDTVTADDSLGWDTTGMADVGEDVIGEYNDFGDEPDFFDDNNDTPFLNNPATFRGGNFNASQHGFQNRNNDNAGGNWGVKQQTLPIVNIGEQEMFMAMNALLYRMFVRIFKDCQYRTGTDNPFRAVHNIYEPLFIGDIPHIKDILVSVDMEDSQGLHNDIDIWNRPQSNLNGCISGLVFKKESSPLPAYRFYLNRNGIKSKRLFLAQNIHKTNKTGSLSQQAINARNGDCIAWFMNIDEGVQNGYIAKMVNGNLIKDEVNRNRYMAR